MPNNIFMDTITILKQQNTNKNYRFSRHYILGTYNPNLIELILKPVIILEGKEVVLISSLFKLFIIVMGPLPTHS